MELKITSKQSIYLELADKIETFIKLGVYKENEKLPSCRKLGVQLKVSPNTIERVYSLLEERGVLYTLPKKGVYVSPKNREAEIEKEIIRTFEHFREIKISKSKLINLINEVYKEEVDE